MRNCPIASSVSVGILSGVPHWLLVLRVTSAIRSVLVVAGQRLSTF